MISREHAEEAVERRVAAMRSPQRWDEEARRLLRAIRRTSRHPSSNSRALPDFLIIGAQRSGTTSLYNYLAGHPGIAPPFAKELHYFTLHWNRTVSWYRSWFPLRRQLVGTNGDRLQTFEASPYYLFHPTAMSRAATVVPDARIVVLLRNPIERAFSHYLHNRRLGFETRSFEEALVNEGRRIHCEQQRLEDDPSYVSMPHQRYAYVDRGKYLSQIERWERAFPDRVLVRQSELLHTSPAETLAEVFGFLGLDARPVEDYPMATKRDPTQPAEMTAATRRFLGEQFRDANAALSEHLGQDLSAWDEG